MNVSVVGGGMMGSAVACRSALAGNPTVIVDCTAELAQKALVLAEKCLRELVEYGLVSPDDAKAEAVKRTLQTWGKVPVIVKRDLPGQLANRILQAMICEAVYIVEIGFATPEDVDAAIKAGPGSGFRSGAF